MYYLLLKWYFHLQSMLWFRLKVCPIDLFIDPEGSYFHTSVWCNGVEHIFSFEKCKDCIVLHRKHFDHYLQKKELCPFDHFSCIRLQVDGVSYLCPFSCHHKINISSSNVQNFNIFEVELFKLWIKQFDHVRKSSKISFSSHYLWTRP